MALDENLSKEEKSRIFHRFQNTKYYCLRIIGDSAIAFGSGFVVLNYLNNGDKNVEGYISSLVLLSCGIGVSYMAGKIEKQTMEDFFGKNN